MLWYFDGAWTVKRKDYYTEWKDGQILLKKKTDCKFETRQESGVTRLCFSGLNITQVHGKWEECLDNKTQTWQATASIEAKMMPSN